MVIIMRDEYDIKTLNPRKNPYAGKVKQQIKNQAEVKGMLSTEYNEAEIRELFMEDGRAEERENTAREKARADAEKDRADAEKDRADAAEEEIRKLKEELAKVRAQLGQ